MHAHTQDISPETLALSTYMAEASARALPPEVVEATKLHILDTLGAIVSGSRLRPGERGRQYVAALGGRPEALVVGSTLKTSAALAALANGMSAHSDETDDSHLTSRTHPGAAIVPAVLAVGQQRGASGEDFLRAVTLGYDVGSRVVHALDMRGFVGLRRSSHGFGGTFGAGAAAGALHGMDEERMRYLLSYCAQSASGCGAYMHDRGHIEKAFVYAGHPAHNGVTAAAMVAAGFTGADDVFSGDRNFLDAYGVPPHRDALCAQLGSRYEIIHSTIKKWCVGSPVQPSLDGIHTLLGRHNITADHVREVVIQMAPEPLNTVSNRPMPNVNIQHLAALMLVRGKLDFASSHDAFLMLDPQLLELRQRVRLVPSEELEHAKPPRQAIVDIVLNTGETVSTRVVGVRGTPHNPMTRGEVVDKAVDLIAPVIGEVRCSALIRQVLTIEAMDDINPLAANLWAEADQ